MKRLPPGAVLRVLAPALAGAALGAALYTFFHPGLRRGNGEDEDEQLDDPDQEVPPSNGRVERVSEVVRFPS